MLDVYSDFKKEKKKNKQTQHCSDSERYTDDRVEQQSQAQAGQANTSRDDLSKFHSTNSAPWIECLSICTPARYNYFLSPYLIPYMAAVIP